MSGIKAIRMAMKKKVVKTAKKQTFGYRWRAIEKGFSEIQKAHAKLEEAHAKLEETLDRSHKELKEANAKTEETLNRSHKELKEANAKTEETLNRSNKELKEANAKTEETLDRSHKELKEANAKTEEALNRSHKDLEEALNRSHKELEETLNNAYKELKEANAKTEETLNKAIASTEKTLNKAIGGLSNTMGSLVEQFMTVGLPIKFKQFGFNFGRITTVKWADGENNIYTEIDGLLENGSQAMAVEVKTTLRNEDVDEHLARMEKVRRYANLHGDNREFLSAIAAAVVDKSSITYALKKGLFVIEPSGEDVKITSPHSVKIW